MAANRKLVVKADLPYYAAGPQQGRPPDGSLARGTRVRLISEHGSFAKVERDDGTTVYVDLGELKAPSASASAPAGRASDAGRRGATRSGRVAEGRLDQVTLRYGEGDLPLTKSDRYIAVKPRAGIDPAVLEALVPAAAGATPGGRLGGFDLVNVAEAGLPAEEALDALRSNPAIRAGSHVFHSSADQVPLVPTGQLYVEFVPDAPPEECQDLIEEHDLEIVETREDGAVIVQVTVASKNPIKTAAALQQSPLVRVAEPDLATPGKAQAFVLPTDDRLIDQWHLRNTGHHRGTALGFRAGADARVVAAWLGHYVGDAHVPLHTTANHDGQLTGQKGLHSYFETKLLNAHVPPGAVQPAPAAAPAAEPHRLAFAWVRESYSFLQTLLDADAAAGGKIKKRKLSKFAQIAAPIAIDRLARGASRTASLWLGAWQEAGEPDLAALANDGAVMVPAGHDGAYRG